MVGLTDLALAHVRHQMLFGIVVPLLVADGLRQKYPPVETALPAWLVPLGAGVLAVLLIVARCSCPPYAAMTASRP